MLLMNAEYGINLNKYALQLELHNKKRGGISQYF